MTIRLPLAKLSQWQQVAFCCALLERMLPNYQMFSQAFEFGESNVLRNQLNLLWQWLDKSQKIKINFDAQLLKLEEQVPDPEAFDTVGVFPAVDACMALMSVMQGIQSKDVEELKNVGLLSQNSVSYFVELTLAEEADLSVDEISQQEIQAHPLTEWEVATQNELFDFIQHAPESKATCQQAKAMALEEGLSNLGIEI